jgi:hypothetical protein
VKESAENVVYLTTGQIDELLPYLSQENLEGTVKEKLDENRKRKLMCIESIAPPKNR